MVMDVNALRNIGTVGFVTQDKTGATREVTGGSAFGKVAQFFSTLFNGDNNKLAKQQFVAAMKEKYGQDFADFASKVVDPSSRKPMSTRVVQDLIARGDWQQDKPALRVDLAKLGGNLSGAKFETTHTDVQKGTTSRGPEITHTVAGNQTQLEDLADKCLDFLKPKSGGGNLFGEVLKLANKTTGPVDPIIHIQFMASNGPGSIDLSMAFLGRYVGTPDENTALLSDPSTGPAIRKAYAERIGGDEDTKAFLKANNTTVSNLTDNMVSSVLQFGSRSQMLIDQMIQKAERYTELQGRDVQDPIKAVKRDLDVEKVKAEYRNLCKELAVFIDTNADMIKLHADVLNDPKLMQDLPPEKWQQVGAFGDKAANLYKAIMDPDGVIQSMLAFAVVGNQDPGASLEEMARKLH